MLSNLIIKKFIKNYKNTEDIIVRNRYGLVGGIVGIITNMLLVAIKISVGLITNSISVIADAFNNISDIASSVITIVGFKMANKPADKEHPFGHGRIEYISAMIVSFMVMLVGFEFIKTSYDRIRNPIAVNFELIPFLLILVSMGIKFWISRFNKYMGNAINSAAFQASSFDALSDVFTSGCVALSLLISYFTTFPIDGYIGILVAGFILYSGFSLVKETLNPLLGEAPDPELVKQIVCLTKNYDYIMGVHDLVIHNYGPGRCMASIHAEVPCDISIIKIHEIIDKAEREISKKLNIYLVIHMDPLNIDDEKINSLKLEVASILKKFPIVKSMHDFRIIGDGDYKNLVFDIVIDSTEQLLDFEDSLKNDIDAEIKKHHSNYNTIITIDKDFTQI